MDSPSKPPIACSLDATGAQEQLAAWALLRSWFRTAERTDAGVTLWFKTSAKAALRDVATKEAACCSFLRLEVHDEPDGVRLEITSDQSDARPVINALATQAGAPAVR